MTTRNSAGVEIARAICESVGLSLEGPDFVPQRIRLELDVFDPPVLTVEGVFWPDNDTDHITTSIRTFTWTETTEEQP